MLLYLLQIEIQGFYDKRQFNRCKNIANLWKESLLSVWYYKGGIAPFRAFIYQEPTLNIKIPFLLLLGLISNLL